MKYKIQVQETVKFDHELIIDVPDDADVDSLLDKAEWRARSLDDIKRNLGNRGVKVMDITTDDSGDNCDAEIIDSEEYEDSGEEE